MIQGIIIGLLFAIIAFMGAFAATKRYGGAIERRANQFASTLAPKGSIIEAPNPEMESWISELKHE